MADGSTQTDVSIRAPRVGDSVDLALLDTYVGSDLSVPFYEQRMGYSRRALRLRKALT